MTPNLKLALAFAGGVLAASVWFVWQNRAPEPAPEMPIAEVVEPVEEPGAEPAQSVPPPEPPKPQGRRPATPPRKPIEPEALTPPPPALPELPLLAAAELPAAPAVSETPQPPQPPPPPPQYSLPSLPPLQRTVTIAEGTLIAVRLAETIDSDRYVAGDAFLATLAEPLVVDGWVIAERGARVVGRITDSSQSGKVKGRASVTLELASMTTSDGQKVALQTARFLHEAEGSKKSDAADVGIAAVIGAVIGVAAGGGKGAGIGAAAGGAAGAAKVLLTRGQAAVLEAETRVSFALERAITLTERR